MQYLNSSCIAWVDYDSGTMQLGFRNGRTYTLRAVPEYHYHGLLHAESKGRYFNTHLKGKY